jgi:hypothetical protein
MNLWKNVYVTIVIPANINEKTFFENINIITFAMIASIAIEINGDIIMLPTEKILTKQATAPILIIANFSSIKTDPDRIIRRDNEDINAPVKGNLKICK